jgi:lipoate-protein ligase B
MKTEGEPGHLVESPRQAIWLDLGTTDYDAAYDIQLRLHGLRQAGEVPDTVLALEHPPCITVGRAGRRESILASEEKLRAAGLTVHATNRGGDVTYHGPGQLVLYPIVALDGYGRDVHAHACRLEQVLIDTLASFGVEGKRRKEYPGVWTAQGKIGALGLRVHRWVTMHGVALNVSPDMSYFSLIVPCGIEDEEVTSLVQILGHDLESAVVKTKMREAFGRVFGVSLIEPPLGGFRF